MNGRCLLAIDTTGRKCAAAIVGAAISRPPLVEISVCCGKAHAQTLLPAIVSLIDLAGISVGDISAIACSMGPGSFTGIRIGAAAAKGLAMGLNAPLVPVDTLGALALGAGLAAIYSGVIIPVIDARRGQVYSASYRLENGLPIMITPPGCYMFKDILYHASNPDTLFTGDGVFGREDAIRERGFRVSSEDFCYPNASAVAAIALSKLASENSDEFGASNFKPFYARLAQAEQEFGSFEKSKCL